MSFTGNHVLDSQTEEFLKNFSQLFASLSNFSIPEQRATIKEMFVVPESELEPIAISEDLIVPGKNGSIKIRLFYPKKEGPLPLILYFHRGGWVYGSIEESEVICRRLANETGSIVIAVEYRLSPENKFPVPLEDCYDATKWVVNNASSLKVAGNKEKVTVCGESAGGNLAAAVALLARDRSEFTVASQLLIYPILTADLEKEHYDNCPDKSLLSYENMEFFLDAYLSSSVDRVNPYAFPLNSNDLSKLPSCFLITAEHDALKHEGKRYGEKLREAGVTVEENCFPGVIHGFLDLPLADSIKKEAINVIKNWINAKE